MSTKEKQPTSQQDKGQGKTSTKRKTAKKAMEEHKKFVEDLGGREHAEKMLDLSGVLYKNRRRGSNANEVAENILQEFRSVVGEKGYYGITEEMIPVVEVYGTIKDKAALCANAYFDMEQRRQSEKREPLLDRERTDEIRAGIRAQGMKSMVEFTNYLSLYEALNNSGELAYGLKKAFISSVYHTLLYINLYEWIGDTEDLISSVTPLVQEDKREELQHIISKHDKYLQTLPMFGKANREESEAGWIKDRKRRVYFEVAETLASLYVADELADLKGYIEALRLWIEKNEAEMFVPMNIRINLWIADKEPIEVQDVDERYFRSHIKKMEESGEPISDADMEVAILPEYAAIKGSKSITKYTLNFLDKNRKIFK